MSAEKRKERRISVSLPARISYQDKRGIPAAIENISRLGAYVVMDRLIPEDATVTAIFTIPPYAKDPSLEGEVRVEANVFRANLIQGAGADKHYGAGLFFTRFLSQQDSDKLSGYIDFLILEEENSIKTGIRRWQGKRKAVKEVIPGPDALPDNKDAQQEIIALLKRIMERLEGIHAMLKTGKQKVRKEAGDGGKKRT